MKKSIQNLERLHQKMQARYGPQDSLVLELHAELVQMRGAMERQRHWPPAGYLRDFDRRSVHRKSD